MEIRPPVVALIWLLTSLAGDRLLPAAWRERLALAGEARWVGLLPVAAGGVLGAWALKLFHAKGTTYEPFGTPTSLVAAGPYRYTRNPMYLGVLLMLTGIALLSGRLTLLAAPLGFLATMNGVQIPREERLLDREFGESFRLYRQRVRRWL